MSTTLFEMHKISMTFPGVKALDQVDFGCAAGEVHALMGENGAGKSTLMKVLSGAYKPDSGKLVVRGKTISFGSPKAAQDCGISIIRQEFNLIPEMNAAENIFLGREPKKFKGMVIDDAYLYERSGQLLERLGASIDPHCKVKNLSVAQQQMVETAKALCLNSDIIIMDEPSAVVSGKELEALFRIIRSLRDDGKAIVYISHRIDEVFQIADRATVLKDGCLVGTVRPKDIDKPTIVRMMVGRELGRDFPPKKKGGKREAILTLKNVCRNKVLKNISLTVYAGEILGIAGLVGSGRTELARIIFGADDFDSGEICFKGRQIKSASPQKSIAQGIGFVTEDRKKEGIVDCFPVRKNLTALILHQMKKGFFISSRKEKRLARNCVRQFNIKTAGVGQQIQYLSGGNQQKVILSKWLNADPTLILLDEPTRGIDIGAKGEIYETMRMLAKEGKAVVMISSELPEIIGMSDRVIVMHEGCNMGELQGAEATEEQILMMATAQVRNHGKEHIHDR